MLQRQNNPDFNYGGQAVIEGVMMRGSKALAVAVRNPQGEIVLHTEELDPRIYGGRLATIPFLRGLTLLWDALGLGIKSLLFSAEVALDEETPAGEDGVEKGKAVFEGAAQWGTVLFSLSLSIGLFFVLPAFLADQFSKLLGVQDSRLAINGLEGMVRLGLLIGYIWAIGFMPDIKRLYGYHGAEHKTINAFEGSSELTPENVARFPLEHPRCGTAFLLTVVIISILFFSLFPPMSLPVRLLSRVVLLPVVAGMGYEFIRFSAKHRGNPLIRWLTKPNLALQKMTTREPDLDMIAVAIVAFQHVLAQDRGQEVPGDAVTSLKPEVAATD